MLFSNRGIGFSTGALAKGDFRHALELLRKRNINIVELSALRDYELPALIEALPSIDLSGFVHVSIHAPSKFHEITEGHAAALLQVASQMGIGIVVHPDTIVDLNIWRGFRDLLWVENLDKRKPIARTTAELDCVFELFPDAGFCLDVAHARQIDPTMSEASRMLRSFGGRLRQIHASGLNSNSTHSALSAAASSAFSQISSLVPQATPIILESPIEENAIDAELEYARNAFSPWLRRLQSDIDDVFYSRVTTVRRIQLEAFLKTLRSNGTRLNDFRRVILQLPTGGPYRSGDVFRDTAKLLELLSPEDTDLLRRYLDSRVEQVAAEFPELTDMFKEQFV